MQINHSTQTAEPTRVKLLRGAVFEHGVVFLGAFLLPAVALGYMIFNSNKGREK